MEPRTVRSAVLLLLGIGLLVAAHLRFGIGVLAWLAPLPFLYFLRLHSGLGARAVLLAASVLGWCLTVLKIITEPLTWVAAFGFGVPMGLVLTVPYLGSDWLRRRLGEGAGTLSFGALTVLAEWSLHGLLPLGTWGSLINTQLDHLALLQLSSLTGTHGVSALMAVCASVLTRLLAGERETLRRSAAAAAVALIGTIAFGQLRIALATSAGHEQRRVAAVGTDSLIGTMPELPNQAQLTAVERGLVARTERAAAAGASIVVWNEAATMIWPQDEEAWTARLQELAARLQIDLVAAYVVPISVEPLRYENKYVYVRSSGNIDHTYFKHEPVPGEPAVRGMGPMPLVKDSGQGSVSGAICYDYDFPRLALEHAKLGADLVVLPSSDWRGIDPIHTEMAGLRAIEGGHSLLRSTRFGLSAGFDPWGQVRGSSSHFDGSERVLVVDLPARRIVTLYGLLGDWFPLICLLFVLGAIARAVVNLRRSVIESRRFDDSAGLVSGDAGGDRGL